MISYKRCSEVDIDLVYKAFSIGFSDYIIKMQISKEAFIDRFFGPEGNSLHSSFIALDGERPVGLILGGIKQYEGIKTMRCGTMAMDPDYRGSGISSKLIELHREEAVSQRCRQLFLEVIVGNDRAINFYKKTGYEKIYNLTYYSLNDINKIKSRFNLKLSINKLSNLELREIRNKIQDIHINWQNDIEYIEASEGQVSLGAYIDGNLVGAVSMNRNTRINLLYVDNKVRGNGIASSLILKASEELKLDKVSIGFPNNASLIGFLNHIGFKKDSISQYEMYITL